MGAERLRELAVLLQEADGFVAIAALVCSHPEQLFGARRCKVSYHATSGQPLLTVDNFADCPDDARLAYLERDWQHDSLLRAMLDRYAPVARADLLLVPVIEPAGIVASIRCKQLDVSPREREADVITVAMLIATRFAQLGITPCPGGAHPSLTPRQREIAELAARGLTTPEIADVLAISPNTVKHRLKEIFQRLSINNRVELVHVLRRQRLVSSDVPVGITRHGALAIARAA
jgi:DNA-binding CsgD family transcriptional regulator